MKMDVLSDVLRMIHLEGALFLNGEFRAPWCVDAPDSAKLVSALRPGAQHLGICHVVLEGQCWIQLKGGDPLLLQAGEAAVLAHGDTHLIGSGLRNASVNLDHIVQVQLPELSRVRYGGGGERSVVACSWFAYEQGMTNPLIRSLPPLFRSSLNDRAAGQWIKQSIQFALGEAASRPPGGDVMGAKVAEMLFIEVLRAYIESLPELRSGWLSGLSDPQVGRALRLLHGEPAHAWTVEALAQEVHMSRSVFADRFNELIGMPPMQYLKRWRLALAARLLGNDHSTLAQVAEVIGYESESAFNRAFKQEYGKAPGLWRRGEARAFTR
jgi:AraC family transcriptional regulator, alkane utilization regulator